MKRQDLEHILRAAGAIMDETSIVVIGSQSILGSYPEAPDELTQSREADIFPKNNPGKAEIIDGAIGEESLFDKTFGYYAQGVDENTAILPKGWRGRLTRVSTSSEVVGYCLDPLDLVASKLAAGRPKDHDYASVFLNHAMATVDEIAERVLLLPDDGRLRQSETAILAWLAAWRPQPSAGGRRGTTP